MNASLLLASIVWSSLIGCSEYGLAKDPDGPWPADTGAPGPDPFNPGVGPVIEVAPAYHDFGSLVLGSTSHLSVTVANVGTAMLRVDGLGYAGSSAELALASGTDGPLPWRLSPGEARVVDVAYAPVDTDVDAGALSVSSNDPRTPVARAEQVGRARPFEGFSTGWYVYDDPEEVATEDPSHPVTDVGDPDGFWYEPSGFHALIGSTDPSADFAALRAWVVARAGAPYPYTGPFSVHVSSNVSRLDAATFAYVVCDFWLDADEDPSAYTLSVANVDDGVRVLLNAALLGEVGYGMAGAWTLSDARPGQVNTLLMVLQDNARVDKFVEDITFARNGVPVP